ncbi:interleukin-5 receptor subunit alpha-like [Rhinoderma darwinii]|uniref:interleukin-5 receptor subunit alpha-like n=1 Tax=Rhinoderma darwinii TaxID=43563 RepID=UPI003F666E38
MDVRISMIIIWIIWQCFQLHLCCHMDELEFDLKAKDLSLSIGNNEAFLTWDCDVPMENLSDVSYDIYLRLEDWEFLHSANVCGEEIALTLPSDAPSLVCLQVLPHFKQENCHNGSDICLISGRNETAENIQCIVYNTSSMKCTWTFGNHIPYKTEYALSLKQDAIILYCQKYINDLEMRTGSCTFQDLAIEYFKDVTVILNRTGSENRVLKTLFKPAEKEILNPPRNFTVTYSRGNVTLSWKSPYTQYPASGSCFHYQMEKDKEFRSEIKNPQSISNLEKECLIRIRAKGDHTCGMSTNWGQWSGEISCDAPQEPSDKSELAVLIILVGLSCFISLLIIIIGVQYKRISKLLFPRIPQPKNFFDETQDYKTNTEAFNPNPAFSKLV